MIKNNPHSGRVMQKAGMKYEESLENLQKNNQGVVDDALYTQFFLKN